MSLNIQISIEVVEYGIHMRGMILALSLNIFRCRIKHLDILGKDVESGI